MLGNGPELLPSLPRARRMAASRRWSVPTARLCPANPALPHMGSSYFRAGSDLPMSVFPAHFPILCLPGDKLFQSKELDDGYGLPPVVHAFHGSKVGLGQKLQQWQSKGLQPLAVSLIEVDEAPPLWTHPQAAISSEEVSWWQNRKLQNCAALLERKYCCSKPFGRQWMSHITTTATHPGPRLAKPPAYSADNKQASNCPPTRSSLFLRHCKNGWGLTLATQSWPPMKFLLAMLTLNTLSGRSLSWITLPGNSIPLTQGLWMFSVLDWVEES